MSILCGVYIFIFVKIFSKRVKEWNLRFRNVVFFNIDYKDVFDMVKEGDFIYCDFFYSYS